MRLPNNKQPPKSANDLYTYKKMAQRRLVRLFDTQDLRWKFEASPIYSHRVVPGSILGLKTWHKSRSSHLHGQFLPILDCIMTFFANCRPFPYSHLAIFKLLFALQTPGIHIALIVHTFGPSRALFRSLLLPSPSWLLPLLKLLSYIPLFPLLYFFLLSSYPL